MIYLADIAAAIDVVKQAIEEADTLNAEQAILLRNQLQELKRETETAIAFLNTSALNTLETQPIQIHDTIYVPKATGKWRPNQAKIRAMVVDLALIDFETGEVVTNTHKVAAQAVTIMTDLFVSPSQMPKKGGLEKMHRDVPDVADYEVTGKQLKEIKVGDDAPAD